MIAETSKAIEPNLLTWAEYMAEERVEGRYDILEGVRYPMPGPSWDHQRIQLNVCLILRTYELLTRSCKVVGAPFDVLIRRLPRLDCTHRRLFPTVAMIKQIGNAE